MRVLRWKLAGLAVEKVFAPPEGAASDLFAQELRAESAQADDVRDRVCVPAFSEHRDRDHAAHVGAKLPALAHGVDDFTENPGVVQVLNAALGMLDAPASLELLDLGRENLLEICVDLPGVFERIAVDEQRRRFLPRLARSRVVV